MTSDEKLTMAGMAFAQSVDSLRIPVDTPTDPGQVEG